VTSISTRNIQKIPRSLT